ncbi:MAG: hypothetical protein PVF73_00710 [Bacteroidales bacterium]
MRKKVSTILAAVLLTATLWAQSPEKMSYQAVIRDADNNLVTGQSIGMQISILQGSADGTAVYVETQTPTTNINGLISIEIGTGTTSDDFSAIDWAGGPYFIKTETDPDGGTTYTITGTSQLLSVPYALHAKTAESIEGGVTETDPVFGASIASGITATDTANWNAASTGSYIETDPIFGASVANGITAADTTSWNNKLSVELDGDPTNEIELPSTANEGEVLTWDGASWSAGSAGESGVGLCISKIADAPSTYATIGNYQFRYNSTTTGGYIEVQAISGSDNMMVFCTKRSGSWELGGSTTVENYRHNISVSTSWNPLMTLWDGSGWNDRVTLSTYNSFEATMFTMGNGSTLPSPLKMYKIFAAIDGYNQVIIRVEYNEN